MATNQTIDELIALWEPRLRQAFIDAIALIRDRVIISVIAERLEKGDVDGAVRAVGLDVADFSGLDFSMLQAFNAGGDATAQSIPAVREPGGAVLKIGFDYRDPIAESWIKERSSGLVQEIVEDQRTTIRQHLTTGLELGQNPRTTALELAGRVSAATGRREGGVIGLHSTQERWLESYSRDLGSSDPEDLRQLLTRGLRDKRYDRSVAKAIREGKPLPADIQAKMRAAYADRALKWRADNIARTETLRAMGQSQTEAYRQAIAKGQVQVDQITRFWLTAGDERVRHTHRLIPGMNKDGRGWNEPFDTPTGPSMHAPHDRDPMCRCIERIRINHFKGLK